MGALIQLELAELNAQKDNQSSVSTDRAQSSNAATFASKAKIPTGNKTPSGVVASFRQQPVARRGTDNARNTTGFKITRPVPDVKISKVERENAKQEAILREIAIRLANAEREAEQRRRLAIREREERAAKNAADARNMDINKRRKLFGGRRRQIRKTRKLKRRPRKITQRAGQRKRTLNRKYRSRKNTRRRR